MTLCSVLIPSRARLERLRKTVRSVRETSDAERVEILVRFDDDDLASLAGRTELEADGVRVVVGPRGAGYGDLAVYYRELSALARGAWIWIMNDDACVAGCIRGRSPTDLTAARGWDDQLAAMPLTGVFAQPELYQLGGSGYLDCAGGAFPLVPNRCWEGLEYGQPGNPIDTWFDQILRVRSGWSVRFLRGVAVVHLRDTYDELEKHRKL